MAQRPLKKSTPPATGLMPLLQYKELIAGLMEQGLPHDDAVATLREGLRQANGRGPSAAARL